MNVANIEAEEGNTIEARRILEEVVAGYTKVSS